MEALCRKYNVELLSDRPNVGSFTQLGKGIIMAEYGIMEIRGDSILAKWGEGRIWHSYHMSDRFENFVAYAFALRAGVSFATHVSAYVLAAMTIPDVAGAFPQWNWQHKRPD